LPTIQGAAPALAPFDYACDNFCRAQFDKVM